ncbi:YidC/Oxa1 family membrane protein insertase [Chloroflexota bacterium]
MVTPVSADPKQQAQSRLMLWMMPMMFGFICMSFPSGLALYWVTSSVIRIIIQYFIAGWGALAPAKAGEVAGRDKKLRKRIAQIEKPKEEPALGADVTIQSTEEGLSHEEPEDKREDRGGGYPERLKDLRRKSGRDRSNRPRRR